MSQENESNLMAIKYLVDEYMNTKSFVILEIIELHLTIHSEQLNNLIDSIQNGSIWRVWLRGDVNYDSCRKSVMAYERM